MLALAQAIMATPIATAANAKRDFFAWEPSKVDVRLTRSGNNVCDVHHEKSVFAAHESRPDASQSYASQMEDFREAGGCGNQSRSPDNGFVPTMPNEAKGLEALERPHAHVVLDRVVREAALPTARNPTSGVSPARARRRSRTNRSSASVNFTPVGTRRQRTRLPTFFSCALCPAVVSCHRHQPFDTMKLGRNGVRVLTRPEFSQRPRLHFHLPLT
jgi:hypothetical protein